MKGLICVSICLWISISQADEVAILYTNDIESVYEPIEAHWRDDISLIGGMAHLSSLIREQRADQEISFLVDAGDIFTGSLSKATQPTVPYS